MIYDENFHPNSPTAHTNQMKKSSSLALDDETLLFAQRERALSKSSAIDDNFSPKSADVISKQLPAAKRHAPMKNTPISNTSRDEVHLFSPDHTSIVKKFGSKQYSPNTLWNQVIQHNQKQKIKQKQSALGQEKDRFSYSKNKDTGIARQRILEWEEHVTLQLEPSVPEQIKLVKAAKQYLLNHNEVTTEIESEYICIHLNSVNVYPLALFGEKLTSYVHDRFGKNLKTNHIPLISGIYHSYEHGHSTNAPSSDKLSLRVVAIAYRDDKDLFHVLLSVKASSHIDEDTQCLGLYKIALFAYSSNNYQQSNSSYQFVNSSQQQHSTMNLKLAEKLVEILPAVVPQTVVSTSQTVDSFQENSATDASEEMNRFNKLTLDEINQDDVDQEAESVISAEEESDNESSSSVEDIFQRIYQEQTISDGNHSNLPAITIDPLLSSTIKNLDSDGSDHEDDDNTHQQPLPRLSNQSIEMKTSPVRYSTAEQRILSAESTISREKQQYHDLLPTTFLACSQYLTLSEMILPNCSLETVNAVTCTSKHFLLQEHSRNIILTSNGQCTESNHPCLVLSGNQLCEWIRGVAISGWLYKWPAKYHGYGQLQKRFFLLRDNLLYQFHEKPLVQDLQQIIYFNNSNAYQQLGKNKKFRVFLLSEETKIEFLNTRNASNFFGSVQSQGTEERDYLSGCVKLIASPSSDETLYLRLRGQKSRELAWIHALQQTIELQRMKRASISSSLKHLWLHDDARCQLVAIDGLLVSEERKRLQNIALYTRAGVQSLKCALFRLPFTAEDVNQLNCCYSMEIIGNESEKLQLQLLRVNESLFTDSALQTTKIYGDKLIIGGSRGFLGICCVAKSTRMNLNLNLHNHGPTNGVNKVLYTIPCKNVLPTGSKSNHWMTAFNHASHATILHIAASTSTPCDIFAAADDQGFVSLWRLPRDAQSSPIPAGSTSTSASSSNLSNTACLDALYNPSNKKPGFYYDVKAEFQSFLHLSQCRKRSAEDRQELDGEVERITDLRFIDDEMSLLSMNLMVSTNKRLLLCQLACESDSPMQSQDSPAISPKPYISGCKFRVATYVEITRIGEDDINAVFAMNITTSNAIPLTVNTNAESTIHSTGSRPTSFNSRRGDMTVGQRVVVWTLQEFSNQQAESLAQRREIAYESLLEYINRHAAPLIPMKKNQFIRIYDQKKPNN